MKTQIFVFGASTEYGCWDFEKGGWVARLTLDLFEREKNEEGDYQVYNMSISGNTSSLFNV